MGKRTMTLPLANVASSLGAFPFQLGEGISEEALKAGTASLGTLALALLQRDIPCVQHRLVCLMVMETVVRYGKVLQQQPQYIPRCLALFLDTGTGHLCEGVQRRAYYLLCRLVKLLKQVLQWQLCLLFLGCGALGPAAPRRAAAGEQRTQWRPCVSIVR